MNQFYILFIKIYYFFFVDSSYLLILKFILFYVKRNYGTHPKVNLLFIHYYCRIKIFNQSYLKVRSLNFKSKVLFSLIPLLQG